MQVKPEQFKIFRIDLNFDVFFFFCDEAGSISHYYVKMLKPPVSLTSS